MSILETRGFRYFFGGLILTALYFISIENYLLFHSVIELFSIIVAICVFILAWNARERLSNHYFLFLGIAYLFVGSLDLIHTLAYKGMGVLAGGSNEPTQLWISSRYMEAVSILLAPLFLRKKVRIEYMFIVYGTVTTLLICSIFFWGTFPVCFIDGVGLTPFKKVSEYIISMILIGSIVVLRKNREKFDEYVFRLLIAAIIITIIAELAFTFYVSVYGISNAVGHYCKLISFYLVYKAIIETGIKRPYDLLFRELKESEGKLKAIIKSMSEGLIVTDELNRVVMMNRAAEKCFSTDIATILNKPIDSTEIFSRLPDMIKETLQAKRTGTSFDIEVPSDDPAEPRVLRTHASVIYDDRSSVLGTVTILSDVSRERSVERTKARFLSTAAHELRNPITSIMGYASIMLSKENRDAKEQKYLSTICDLSTELENIISDLLDISKIESGKGFAIEKSKVNANEYIKGLVSFYSDLSKKHQFEFYFPEGETIINLDKEKLRLLISNLMSNACKYSPKGGKITVTGMVEGTEYIVTIEDSGIGMTPNQVDKIFDEFYRADPSNWEIKGTGLGMAIVKRLVSLLNGRIRVDSELGRGTNVTFTLPLSSPEKAASSD